MTTAPAAAEHDLEVYDFRRPLTLAREHARVLEMAYGTFARQWGTQLTARTRALTTVTLASVRMTSYDDYVRSLPTFTSMILCTIEPSRHNAVLQMPIATGMGWVDLLLGGNGKPNEAERDYTDIEQTLIKELLGGIVSDLSYAFANVMPLAMTIRQIQYNPQFVQAAPASDAVICATFDINTADQQSEATLMIPADLLMAGLRQNETLDRSEDELAARLAAMADLDAAVADVPVDVAVRFAPRTIHPRDVVDLHVGDVLSLTHQTNKPLDVVVGDVLLAHAAAGSSGSRLACVVTTVEEKS